MDAQQIKDLIASKIAGQGNQVDSGGALSTILNAIVDAVAAIPVITVPTIPDDGTVVPVGEISDYEKFKIAQGVIMDGKYYPRMSYAASDIYTIVGDAVGEYNFLFGGIEYDDTGVPTSGSFICIYKDDMTYGVLLSV